MHYTMGGLWVDYNQATNLKGIFAAGECEYAYHGANRLGANSLGPCIWGGFVAGPQAVLYAKNNAKSADAVSQTGFDSGNTRPEEFNTRLMNSSGTENPFRTRRELCEL